MRAQRAMSKRTLVTAAELERFPRDDNRYELVDGRLVPMSPVSVRHGSVVVHFASKLHEHVRSRGLGLLVAEVGFVLARDPDTVRAPDLAFIPSHRVPPRDARGFFDGPPDLAVEVTSPEDRAPDTSAKIEDYLRRGVGVVLVLDPHRRTASVYRRLAPRIEAVADDDAIDLDDVVPGFRCAIRDTFD